MKKEELDGKVAEICRKYAHDRTRLMDILWEVQREFTCISDEAVDAVAEALEIPRVEVESTASFYAFFSRRPAGKVVIRLCDDIIDRLQGADRIREAFERELGIRVGETTADGKISLTRTACIGMSDQAPAALVNDVVVTRLSTDLVHRMVAELREHLDPQRLVREVGDGNNAHPLVNAMVENNLRLRGPVIFAPFAAGEALQKALAMTPAEVIRSVKTARLRGRGGAGFPTGMKWEFTRNTPAERRFLICNADEGEPGTFKDRVILTECPHLLFEGMTIGGYAIGAKEGIVYLRGEYAYLRPFLEAVLEERRQAGLLGRRILGRPDFDFDIRIQLGAGAYVCGEETALISSCEGLRGDPKNRPPFPAQRGYLGYPTAVNNVETLCCVARLVQEGPAWFAQQGSDGSAGTKVLSVSGDCRRPGVYELPFGVSLRSVLEMVGADDVQAVQVGGPSGQLVGPADFDRHICFDDLATGGSIMVFDRERDLLEIVEAFLEFFVDESCGYCTPCRVGNRIMLQYVQRIRSGKATADDVERLRELAVTVKRASRCGLGQTSPNPVLNLLERFPQVVEPQLRAPRAGVLPSFDLETAVEEASRIAGRKSVQHVH
ncbi:MAG: NADH-quinone oxidoreductase subunit NuoF [Acidobacteriota bacterium]